ncbi:uncharacterized protein LOC142346189 [Convolutriloba macropyga]|uniref:uncharacterized protein LOC142346189 n=1 Tax=Convolutriloba macropyga TaxID=536237 RepID=UPI003F523821
MMPKTELKWPIRSHSCNYSVISLSIVLLFAILYFANKTWKLNSPRRLYLPTTKTLDLGTATSGKVFQGLKIRSFPRQEIKFAENDNLNRRGKIFKSRPSWAHQRLECRKWSVILNDFHVPDAIKNQITLPADWCIVIVGDMGGPDKYPFNEGKQGRVIYLNARDQVQLAAEGVKLSETLPWNHYGRKNVGYLYATASGAQLIWDFDSNNYLLSTPAKVFEPNLTGNSSETIVLQATPKGKQVTCSSFNPMSIMSVGKSPSWLRGLPLDDIKAEECQRDAYIIKETAILERKIAVYQSLPIQDQDVNATSSFNQKLSVNFKHDPERLPLMVPDDAFAPFNSQATLFTYEAFFMLFLPVTVHARVSDVWRSYLGQKLLKDCGYSIVFTPGKFVQNRNVLNISADFNSEKDLNVKSGKLIQFLKYNWTSNCEKSLECHFESLVVNLYEHDYIQLSDVYHFQTWIKSLHDYGYIFPQMEEKVAKLQPDKNAPHAEDVEPKWPDLMLFVPAFPGGEHDLNNYLLRSLKFFWPKSYLRLMVVLDGELKRSMRDRFARRIKNSMKEYSNSTQVVFNYIPKEVYNGVGHDRQQLIMFWADNFTNAEYVGFLDDDSMVTNYVLYEDLFDQQGRPHVMGRSPQSDNIGWQKASNTTRWTDNSSAEIMRTMNYFPVIVKTSHLKVVRESVLKHLPQFSDFDDFYRRGVIEANRKYSQFNIIHQHLWKLKKDEYNWHLQPLFAEDYHFKMMKRVTEEMTNPKPRCVLHVTSDGRQNSSYYVEDVFQQGFCYSLSKAEFDAGGEYSQLCNNAGYSWDVVSNVPNTNQWVFDWLDWRWDNRTIESNRKRVTMNRARPDWNEKEVKRIFAKRKNAFSKSGKFFE